MLYFDKVQMANKRATPATTQTAAKGEALKDNLAQALDTRELTRKTSMFGLREDAEEFYGSTLWEAAGEYLAHNIHEIFEKSKGEIHQAMAIAQLRTATEMLLGSAEELDKALGIDRSKERNKDIVVELPKGDKE